MRVLGALALVLLAALPAAGEHEVWYRYTVLGYVKDAQGRRPCHGDNARFATDPHWKDLVLFHEYFHGETGKGVGASHQTGWTALAVRFLGDRARAPSARKREAHAHGREPRMARA